MASKQILRYLNKRSKLLGVTPTSSFSQICNFSSTSSEGTDDQVTHTGQKFDKDDYRLVRFINKEKHVNTQFAINLIDEVPPAKRKERVVWCDGGGGPTGHPKVYINLDKPGNHACGYCGLRFKKEDHH